jgi:SAM-dependent methyltransferase
VAKRERERSRCRGAIVWFAAWCLLAQPACTTTGAAGHDDPTGVREQSAEPSLRPGINERWKSPQIEPLIESLETESREIYVNRRALAAVAGPRPGSAVADVGAGSGFMVREFAALVGPAGTVYAVDINPELMVHVARESARTGLANVRTIVCGERSVDLPRGSVDMVFICDTYHHFEYPRSTLRSIHDALRPGGQIVLVDFRRIPGVSREFIIDHVRAGEEAFTREIVAAGFELINDHDVPFLEENYLLRFRKRDR